jgi:hypothetical protein
MAENSTIKVEGPGLVTLLTVLFVGLKLTGYIAWSWWWVLSPLWISALVGLFILGVLLIVLAVAGVND